MLVHENENGGEKRRHNRHRDQPEKFVAVAHERIYEPTASWYSCLYYYFKKLKYQTNSIRERERERERNNTSNLSGTRSLGVLNLSVESIDTAITIVITTPESATVERT